MIRGTRLYSVLFNKCPRCHTGNFFKVSNPFNLAEFSAMNEKCPHCGEDFKREVGFYYGAMYASYGLTVLYGILLFLLMVVALDTSHITYLVTFVLSILLLLPVFFRTSRLIWINLFVGPKK